MYRDNSVNKLHNKWRRMWVRAAERWSEAILPSLQNQVNQVGIILINFCITKNEEPKCGSFGFVFVSNMAWKYQIWLISQQVFDAALVAAATNLSAQPRISLFTRTWKWKHVKRLPINSPLPRFMTFKWFSSSLILFFLGRIETETDNKDRVVFKI